MIQTNHETIAEFVSMMTGFGFLTTGLFWLIIAGIAIMRGR